LHANGRQAELAATPVLIVIIGSRSADAFDL
jgi:hypothetical protein